MDTITVTLVVTDGVVDQAASTATFEAALASHVAERETETAVIAETVAAIFDENKGRRIALSTLASLAVAKLNAQPSNHKALTDKVLGYVRENMTGTSPIFGSQKGRNGGVARIADLPVVDSK